MEERFSHGRVGRSRHDSLGFAPGARDGGAEQDLGRLSQPDRPGPCRRERGYGWAVRPSLPALGSTTAADHFPREFCKCF